MNVKRIYDALCVFLSDPSRSQLQSLFSDNLAMLTRDTPSALVHSFISQKRSDPPNVRVAICTTIVAEGISPLACAGAAGDLHSLIVGLQLAQRPGRNKSDVSLFCFTRCEELIQAAGLGPQNREIRMKQYLEPFDPKCYGYDDLVRMLGPFGVQTFLDVASSSKAICLRVYLNRYFEGSSLSPARLSTPDLGDYTACSVCSVCDPSSIHVKLRNGVLSVSLESSFEPTSSAVKTLVISKYAFPVFFQYYMLFMLVRFLLQVIRGELLVFALIFIFLRQKTKQTPLL